MERRRFLHILGGFSTIALTGWTSCSDSGLVVRDDDLALTPSQTEGPFYPVPSIEQQLFNDIDLTRKLPTDSLAAGQLIDVSGTVKNQSGAPLPNSVVEIWQASELGLYNHPNDNADNPDLDQDFQFWGRAITGEDGAYAFKTIIPGEYPGRAARHIHYRVDSPGYNRLTTQCYFSEYADRNRQDGIFGRLSEEEQALLTVQVDDSTGEVWVGGFDVVLAVA